MAKRAIRPIRIEGNDAFITLTMGFTTVIDVQDLDLVMAGNWCAMRCGSHVYAGRSYWDSEKYVRTLLHRLLIKAPSGMLVDHIDGDGLNNRRGNLRLATQAQNQWNRPAGATNQSGIKGVCWASSDQKWRAQICIKGKRIFLGNFDNIDEARDAYISASKLHHGEFAHNE